MDPFVQGLHNLLVQSTANDTVQLKAATAQLNKDYYKNPACIPALAEIIAASPDQGVRQLAAVELRKRIGYKSGDLWVQVPQEQRNSIKAKLPEITLHEPSKLVRHSSARVISAVAQIEIPDGLWPELLPLLHQCCTSPLASTREVGIFVLFTVLENIVEGFQEHLQQIFKLFEGLLKDPESAEVRVTTVRALGVVAQYIAAEDKEDVRAFQAALPAMIDVLQHALQTGDEQSARHLFDVFETLLILEVPLLSKSIPQLVEFFLASGANQQYDEDLRIMALNALSWTVKYKKSKVQSAGLAPDILRGLMPITTETEPEDIEDEAPSRSALRIVDILATSLPPNQVFPTLSLLIQQYMSSADPSHRRGSILALGVAVEGCSEYMTPHMKDVWPIIMTGLNDQDASVRKASCTAVACLCEWLEEECVSKHDAVLPVIMTLVNDPATQRAACTALDAFLEVMGQTIEKYLDELMQRLSGLLETAPLKVKAVVTGAIGSAAHASKGKFTPYFQPTMEKLKHFLVLVGEGDEVELRGIAMDTVGTFAEAVGKDAFRPYYPELMAQALQALRLGNARLRECSFLFFGVMARVFGDEFAPYLSEVVASLINSCGQEESGDSGTDLKEAAEFFGTSSGAGTSASSAINVTEGDIDVEDIDTEKLLEVNSAIAVEKEIAADTIGTIFAATGVHFLEYVEQCTLELVGLLPHYYEGIRKSATDSLLEIIRTFYKLSNPEEWSPGASGVVQLHQKVRDLINHALPPLLDMYETEDDKSVASALCVGLAETINVVGPAFLEGHLDTVSGIAIQILEQKALCQQDPDQDEDDEPLEDQAEYDSVLISSAGDLVSSLASVLGPDFVQAFNTFFPLISKYYGKNRSLSDRASAIGTLAEIISGMKDSITPYTERLLALFYEALSDPEYEVHSNAAFAIGLLVEHSKMDLSSQYLPILTKLRSHFQLTEENGNAALTARDNAAGAVARLILTNVAALPLDQVLPVFFGALPLKSDYLENRPVFRAIFYLFQNHTQVIFPYVDQLLPVFAYVLDPNAPDQLGDEVRADLRNLLNLLNTELPGKLPAAGLAPYLPGA